MRATNPIIPGFNPNPSICRVENDYYLVTSSFIYFPGVPVYHSRDLAHWRHIGYCLTRREQLRLDDARFSRGIWAPTLRYHNGLFYMVTTNISHGGNFFVTASDPAGEWSDPMWFDPEGWDPSLLFDDDGTVYLTRALHEPDAGALVVQYRLDVASGKRLDQPRLIWPDAGEFGLEAPHLYKINGRYYLLIAAGGTHQGHLAMIARSDNPWGPFEPCPHNPILTHRHRLFRRIQAVGHADLVQALDGNWWLVCLGIRNYWGGLHPFHHLGRESFIAPVIWTEDGWPVINGGDGISPEVEITGLGEHVWETDPPRDEFDQPSLQPCWNFIRNPNPAGWTLTQRPGWVGLHGSPLTLDGTGISPTFIGRRQLHPNCRAAALLDFEPGRAGDEAGLTVFMSDTTHCDLAVCREDGQRVIRLRRKVGDLDVVTARAILPDGLVTLEITANPWAYTFAYLHGAGSRQVLGEAQTRFVSSELAGSFSGVYLGMYATGNGQPATTPAFFDWFEYKGLEAGE